MSIYSQQSFSSSTWKRGAVWICKLGVISQERLKIEVKLLLSANSKSYMPRRLAQQRMTLSDLEWPFHALRAISAVAELLVVFVLRRLRKLSKHYTYIALVAAGFSRSQKIHSRGLFIEKSPSLDKS